VKLVTGPHFSMYLSMTGISALILPVELGSPPSTMECFDLQALPFDVLVLVFQFLDSRSLLAACLTSKGLREIATPLLYEDVQLGPSPRCERYDLRSNVV
jgi:hypothetical protein